MDGHYSLQIDASGLSVVGNLKAGKWEAVLYHGRGPSQTKATHATLAESMQWATNTLTTPPVEHLPRV